MKHTTSFRIVAAFAGVALALMGCGGGPAATPATTPATTGASTTAAPGTTTPQFDAAAHFGGRTITFIINGDPGGTADTVARIVAEHLKNHIPGNPRVVISNSDGVTAFNLAWNAKPDGYTVGVTTQTSTTIGRQLTPEAQYDMREARVIGGHLPQPRVFYMDGSLSYNTLSDAIGSDGPTLVYPGSPAGPEGVDSHRLVVPWLCDRLDIPCKMLQVADDGTDDILLMFERDEASLGSTLLSGLVSRGRLTDLESGNLKLLFAQDWPADGSGLLPDGVPQPVNYEEVITDEMADEWEALQGMVTQNFTVHYFLGPDVPDPVVASLQQAMVDMFAESTVATDLQDALDSDLSLIPGPEAETIVHDAAADFLAGSDTVAAIQQEMWDKYWGPQ